MSAFQQYQRHRRAGRSPCRAYQLANETTPSMAASAVCYAAAVVLVLCSTALIVG